MVYTQGKRTQVQGLPLPGKLEPRVLQSGSKVRGINLLYVDQCRYGDSIRSVQLLKGRFHRNPRKDLEHAHHRFP